MRDDLGAARADKLDKILSQGLDARHKGVDGGGDVEGLWAIAQEPQGAALNQTPDIDQHVGLDLARRLVIERLDGRPQGAQAIAIAGDGIGPGNLAGGETVFFREMADKGGADPVDHAVGHRGCDDLAAQAVTINDLLESLAHGFGEIAHEIKREIGVLGQVGLEQGLIKRHLAVGEQHREFGAGEAHGGLLALLQNLIVGQTFEGAVERAGAFQLAHQPGLAFEQPDPLGQGDVDRLGLVVVVEQHQIADLVGHFSQHAAALPGGHMAIVDGVAEQDLDIDLMVRAIDAGRIVDGVRIDMTAPQGVFDAAALGEPEIAALADHPALQIAAIDTEPVVGAVSDLGVAFIAGLHIGADAAVPQQIDRG